MKVFNVFSYVISAMLLLASATAHAQNYARIDNLKKELEKLEVRKKDLGENAARDLDTTTVRIQHSIITELFKGNPLDAFDLANEQLTLSKRIKYDWGISQASNTLGVIHDYKGDFKKAISFYEESLKIKEAAGDEYGLVDTNINIGVLYGKQFDYPRALNYLYRALEIAKKTNDNLGIFGAYNNIGVLYTSQNKYDEAIKNYLNCLKLQLVSKDHYFIATTHQNIGEAYLGINNYEKALEHFEKGLKTAQQVRNREAQAGNHDGLGKIFLSRGAYDKARNSFETSFEIRKEKQDELGMAYSYMHLADVYYEELDFGQALDKANKALVLFKKYGELASQAHGYELLSKIYDQQGNHKKAYDNLVLYKALNDSIFSLDSAKKITEVQLKYYARSIQDSLQAVQEKKDLLEREEARVQRNTTNFIFLGLSIVLIFLVVLLVQKNKIETIRRQKALEEERNRISRNLHDDLGAQLSAVRMFISSIKNQEDKNKIEETVENSLGLLDSSIQELRNIMNDIRTFVLHEQGYIEATEVLVNKINQLHVMNFELSHHNIDKRFNAKIEHELYRVTQELVNNTLKYAKAKNVYIDLLKRDGTLVFMYEDDGVGFDPDTLKSGNGLENIQTRMTSLGGKVSFDTAPGKGFRIIIEIPL
jgi:two-component system NarL family sensor kinase